MFKIFFLTTFSFIGESNKLGEDVPKGEGAWVKSSCYNWKTVSSIKLTQDCVSVDGRWYYYEGTFCSPITGNVKLTMYLESKGTWSDILKTADIPSKFTYDYYFQSDQANPKTGTFDSGWKGYTDTSSSVTLPMHEGKCYPYYFTITLNYDKSVYAKRFFKVSTSVQAWHQFTVQYSNMEYVPKSLCLVDNLKQHCSIPKDTYGRVGPNCIKTNIFCNGQHAITDMSINSREAERCKCNSGISPFCEPSDYKPFNSKSGTIYCKIFNSITGGTVSISTVLNLKTDSDATIVIPDKDSSGARISYSRVELSGFVYLPQIMLEIFLFSMKSLFYFFHDKGKL